MRFATLRPCRSLALLAGIALVTTLPSASDGDTFVVSEADPGVVVFPPTASGQSAPIRRLHGPATELVSPAQVTLDPTHGEMVVADFQGFAVRFYPLTATGDTAPLRSLTNGPLSGIGQPRDAVVDPVHNELIVTSFLDKISTFSRTAAGDVAPLRVIAGPATRLDNPNTIFDAAHDELFVSSNLRSSAGTGLGAVYVFPRIANGDQGPSRVLTSSSVAYLGPYAAIDVAHDELIIVCNSARAICVFPRSASGDAVPLRIIAGPTTLLHEVTSLVLDSKNDRILVGQSADAPGFPGQLLSFPRTASGEVAPLVTVTRSEIANPFGLALDSGGGLTGGTPDTSRTGLVYALQSAPAGNRIFGFVVNEATGALTALPGFPVATGGRGDGLFHPRFLTQNGPTARLFAYNNLDGTVSGFTVNRATGALQRLPYSPFPAGTRAGNCLEVSPTGSPLLLTDSSASFQGVRGFTIGALVQTPTPGSPLFLAAGSLVACGFEAGGRDFYAGGGVASDTFLTGLRIDYSSGTLLALDGVPFNSGGPSPTAFALAGSRLLVAHQTAGTVRAFLRDQDGAPDTFDGVSHASGISNASTGAATPFGYYYVADPTGNQVGAYRLALAGTNTSWSTVAGSPFAVGAGTPGLLAVSDAGNLLVVGRMVGRSLATYRSDPATGALTPLAAQASNSEGNGGQLNGLVYFGGTAPATPINFRAVIATRTTVTLRWLDRADNESSFVLEMRRGNQPFAVVGTLGPNVGVAQLTKLTPGAAYTFRLRARNVLGDSATVLATRTLPK